MADGKPLRCSDPSEEAYVGESAAKLRRTTDILEACFLSRNSLSHDVRGRISVTDISVKEKIGSRITPDSIPARIRALRQRLGMDQTVLAQHIGVKPTSVSEWESGKYRPSAMALVAIGHLDLNNEMWWFEQAGPEYADRLKTVQLVEDAQAKRRKLGESGASPPPWDPELLTFVIETMDAELTKRRKTLPIGKYAELIILVYEYCHKLGKRDSDIVAKLLKIA